MTKNPQIDETNPIPEVSDAMLPGAIEALLFVSGEPLSVNDLADALGRDRGVIGDAVEMLAEEYEARKSGIAVLRFGEQVQLGTRGDYAALVDRYFSPATKQSLSQSAIETLSIIAYRQPITRAEVEQIRGVRCEYAVSSLQNKGLICEVGRKDSLGRPILYGTTELFLRNFDLRDVSELPNREELTLELGALPEEGEVPEEATEEAKQE